MKCRITLICIFCLPLMAAAQFEQKVSVSFSGGVFSTIGPKLWMPDWGSVEEDKEPHQIANYKPGFSGTLGIQYNLNRHFSFQADVGIMHSGDWFYDIYDGHNYTGWAIWDPVTDELLAEGFNELTMLNVGVGLTPKYYLLPGKKLNPFLYAGLSINFTSTTFEDNEWQALHDHGLLDPDDSGPDRAYIENNTGLGLHPGLGIEFSINDNIGFHILTGYYLILLSEENFYVPEQHENLNAIILQSGLKLSFLKSKDI